MAKYQQDTCLDVMYKNNAPLCDQALPLEFFNVDPTDPENRSKWVWNPVNAYNATTRTGTIAHLIQKANTLAAEVDIAAQATVLRKDRNGNPVTASQELIKCSLYGNRNRNSDPTVSPNCRRDAKLTNALAR